MLFVQFSKNRFFFVMSHLLLDNCHHNHCCHGAYTETINQMMKTINNLSLELSNIKSELDKVKPKEVKFSTTFGDCAYTSGKDISSIFGYSDKTLYIQDTYAIINSTAISPELTAEVFDNAYKSNYCIFKIQTKYSNLEYSTYTRVYTDNASNTIEFIGNISTKYINGYQYRVILKKDTKDNISLEWRSIGKGSVETCIINATRDCVLVFG